MDAIVCLQNENDILRFCSKHRNVFLYGAGRFGKVYCEYLKNNNVHNITGFLVSEKVEATYCGFPVFDVEDGLLRLDHDCGVILSLSKRYHDEILRKYVFPCQIGVCNDSIVNVISCNWLFAMLDDWQSKRKLPRLKMSRDTKRILVIQVEHTYGDIIWSTGFLRELRLSAPYSHITMVLNSKMMSLFKYCPYVDEFIGYNLKRGMYDACSEEDCRYAMDFCGKKNFSYDVVYLPRLLPCNLYDLWENVFLAIGSRAIVRVAHMTVYMEEMKLMYRKILKYFTEVIKHEVGEHEAFRNMMLLSQYNRTIRNYKMELWISMEEINYAKSILKIFSSQGKVFIAVGLVGSNPARSWSPEKYNELVGCVYSKYPEAMFVLCGGEDGIEAAQEVKRGREECCIDLTGKTSLLQVAAIIDQCDFYLGSDTGIMHMASAFQKPVIELSYSLPDSPENFGSHPTRTGPWCVYGIVLRPPYGLDGCKYICRKNYAHCINLIEVSDVTKSIESVFKYIEKENNQDHANTFDCLPGNLG